MDKEIEIAVTNRTNEIIDHIQKCVDVCNVPLISSIPEVVANKKCLTSLMLDLEARFLKKVDSLAQIY